MHRFLWLGLFAGALLPAQPSAILAPGHSWELLGEGYQLTSDPTADPSGIVYFTDARRNRILRIDLDGKISTWKEGSNGAHGIAFGPDGRLYAGQHDLKRIAAFNREGAESVFVDGLTTHHLVVSSRNEIYCTEPPAKRVWMVTPAGQKRVLHEGLGWPRGVRVSADRTRLAVNDARSNWVWMFRVQDDGSLADGRQFCGLQSRDAAGPDPGGMAFDAQGNLYVASMLGVQVCDPQGRIAEVIPPPGKDGLNNVLFAGPGRQWLYITDGERFYRRLVRRRGD